jgi:hypothetical protein
LQGLTVPRHSHRDLQQRLGRRPQLVLLHRLLVMPARELHRQPAHLLQRLVRARRRGLRLHHRQEQPQQFLAGEQLASG